MPGRSAAQTSVGDNGGGMPGSRAVVSGDLVGEVDGVTAGVEVAGGVSAVVRPVSEHAVIASSRIALRANRHFIAADCSHSSSPSRAFDGTQPCGDGTDGGLSAS